MIKEFIKRFFVMLFYAWVAGAFSMFIGFLFFSKYYDHNWENTFFSSLYGGGIGLVLAAPILILFAPWFWHVKNKRNFLFWSVIPVLLSLAEVLVLGASFNLRWNEILSTLAFVFPLTALQIALFMWLTYSKNKNIEVEVSSAKTTEVENACN